MLLLSVQADADSFYTACNGRQFNSIEDAVCQLVYVERAEVIKSEEVRLGFHPEARLSVCLPVSNLSLLASACVLREPVCR